MQPKVLLLVSMVCVTVFAARAADGSQTKPYAGEEQRTIKSLSVEDIDDLRNGRGWGLARAAELNGLPGPVHLLELRTEIALSPQQVEQIEALFEAMKARAVPLGETLVELERSLSDGFANNTVSPASLRELLGKIAAVRAELRFVHLETHLRTPALLSQQQIAAYNRLRGYTSGHSHDGRH